MADHSWKNSGIYKIGGESLYANDRWGTDLGVGLRFTYKFNDRWLFKTEDGFIRQFNIGVYGPVAGARGVVELNQRLDQMYTEEKIGEMNG